MVQASQGVGLMDRLAKGLRSIRWGVIPAFLMLLACSGWAQASEADLVIPDLKGELFLGTITGHGLFLIGLVVCLAGIAFGLWKYSQIKALPVHKSMSDISELIYETCKTYLFTQGKFLS